MSASTTASRPKLQRLSNVGLTISDARAHCWRGWLAKGLAVDPGAYACMATSWTSDKKRRTRLVPEWRQAASNDLLAIVDSVDDSVAVCEHSTPASASTHCYNIFGFGHLLI